MDTICEFEHTENGAVKVVQDGYSYKIFIKPSGNHDWNLWKTYSKLRYKTLQLKEYFKLVKALINGTELSYKEKFVYKIKRKDGKTY